MAVLMLSTMLTKRNKFYIQIIARVDLGALITVDDHGSMSTFCWSMKYSRNHFPVFFLTD